MKRTQNDLQFQNIHLHSVRAILRGFASSPPPHPKENNIYILIQKWKLLSVWSSDFSKHDIKVSVKLLLLPRLTCSRKSPKTMGESKMTLTVNVKILLQISNKEV